MAAITHATARKVAGGGFLLGMFVGLLVGLVIALAIALYLNKTPIPFMTKKPVAEDAKAAGKPPALAGMPQSGTAPATAPVPPKAPATTAAKGPEKPRFDFYKILPGGEEPVSERELRERLRATAAAKSQPAAAQDVYFIQAGAFQNPADADNQKARLAILGFESNVEPTTLPDKGTWYRVRLGPYTKVDELNKVRQALAQNGIDANLVKLKDPASAKAN
jgi:cell division protein FtsN